MRSRQKSRCGAATGVVVGICLASPLPADTIDPLENGSQYAWSENAGWVNFEPATNDPEGSFGASVFVDHVRGWGWAENVGWVNLSCENLGGCNTVAFGVVNDGFGNLAGYAWAENAGWISFSCENTGSCGTVDYGVTVDPVSGDFSGYGWSENLGWVGLSCENTASCAGVEYRVTTQIPFPELLFADGFESGDTSEWNEVSEE